MESHSIGDGIPVVRLTGDDSAEVTPAALAGVVAAAADSRTRAIVLALDGRRRPAEAADTDAGFADAADRIEASPVPVVALLDGDVPAELLEIALACDRRIATAGARFAFRHVEQGRVPSAGGTQRLPRVVGIEHAVRAIAGGERIGAEAAAARGLIDALVPAGDDDTAAAIRFAAASAGGPRRTTRARSVSGDAAAIDAARARALPPERGGACVHAALDLLDAALRLPFAEGCRRERAAAAELLGTDESKARRHLASAERAAAQPPAGVQARRRVRTAAVVGAGTMGTGIAMALADAGIDVTLIEADPAALDRARTTVAAAYAAGLRKSRITASQHEQRLQRIRYGSALGDAAPGQLIVEAVFEDLAVKTALFRALDAVAAPDAILATNTSSLDIDAIARATGRPQDVVGLHFFSPANVMQLLEIVRGERTSAQTVADALAFAHAIGKTPVVAGNGDGFIGNRMLYAYRREAEFLVEEGAAPHDVDAAMTAFGFAMGPFAVADLAGLDIGWRVRKQQYARAAPAGRVSTLADRLCEAGRFGQKTGAGWYRYEPGSRVPLPDPAVEAIIDGVAREAGIARRRIGDGEIVKRCLFALINEAARILADGIAARPGDIDVVWSRGYGFPAWRGGPLWYADALGLAPIYAAIREFERIHGARWSPAPLLRDLALRAGSFAGWDAPAQRS